MKKRNWIKWEKQREVSAPRVAEMLLGAAWDAIAMPLLVFAAISMLYVLTELCMLGIEESRRILRVMLCAIVFFEGIARVILGILERGKGKRIARLIGKTLPLLIPVAGWFIYRGLDVDALKGGTYAIAAEFFRRFNKLTGSGVIVRGMVNKEAPYALCNIAIFVFLAIYFLVLVTKKKWLFFLCPMASVVILMNAGLAPNWSQLLFTATGLFMLSGEGFKKGMALRKIVMAALFFITFAALGMIFQKRADDTMQYALRAKDYEKTLEQNLKTTFSKMGSSKSKRISNTRPKYKDAVVMTVRCSRKPTGNLYFQEFCGTDYVDGTWTSDDSGFERACQEHDTETMDAIRELSSALYYAAGRDIAEYQIRYKGVFGQKMLLPYGVSPDYVAEQRYQGDSVALKSPTTSVVTFQGALSNEYINENQPIMNSMKKDDFWDWYENYAEENYLDAPDYSNLFPVYAESYEYESADPFLGYFFENLERLSKADFVGTFMRGNGSTYTWNMDGPEAGEDVVEHFLKNGRRGYCIHFASASTILLRNYDVPARYVAGYVAKPSMFKEQEDGSYLAEVIDRNAHAWVEIYLRGIGWVPMEMTPGYDDSDEGLPTSKEAEEERSASEATPAPEESEETPTPAPTPEEPEEETKPSEEKVEETPMPENQNGGFGIGGGEGGLPLKSLFRIGAGILLVALAAVLVTFVRRSGRRRMQAALRKKYYRGAVKVANKLVYGKVRAKTRRRIHTDSEFEKALILLLGKEKRSEIAQYLNVVRAASYSQENIGRDEFATVWRLYAQVKKSVLYKQEKK